MTHSGASDDSSKWDDDIYVDLTDDGGPPVKIVDYVKPRSSRPSDLDKARLAPRLSRPSELDKAILASMRPDWENGRLDAMLKTPKVRHSGFELDICLRTLRPGQLIDGEIINFWADEVYANLSEIQRNECIFLKCDFYSRISSDKYEFIETETREFPDFETSALRRFFMPITIKGHWILAVISLELKTVTFYDSLTTRNEHGDEFKKIQMWLNGVYERQGIISYPRFRSKRPKNVPKQEASIDCGVFVCMYLAYACIRKVLDFGQDDMDLFRKWISYNISKRYI